MAAKLAFPSKSEQNDRIEPWLFCLGNVCVHSFFPWVQWNKGSFVTALRELGTRVCTIWTDGELTYKVLRIVGAKKRWQRWFQTRPYTWFRLPKLHGLNITLSITTTSQCCLLLTRVSLHSNYTGLCRFRFLKAVPKLWIYLLTTL